MGYARSLGDVQQNGSFACRRKTTGGLDLTAAYTGDEAVRRARCVFSVLKEQMQSEDQRELAAFLPDEVSAWFLSA